jgi:serine/threonine protein kinase
MNAAHGNHPSVLVLQLFDEGRLDEGEVAALMGHLDACPHCQEIVKTLPADSLLRRLRAAHAAGGTLPEMSVEQVTRAAAEALDLPPEETAEEPPLDILPGEMPLDLPPELREHKQYSVERELGRGGMGVVYLARDGLMNRLIVLKVVNSLLVRETGMRDRFLREIQLAALLGHPNVVTAYHAEQIGQLLVLVMEYAPGETLELIMANRKGRPLPVVNACHYARQVAFGLQYAFEQGLVHRDIKPANLILTVTQKKTHLVRILDFGLAKARSDSEGSSTGLTGLGAMMGTPAYMAPEQSDDASRADIRADIYSLGCTLYFLLAGRPPFEAKSLRGLLDAHALKAAVPLSQVHGDVSAELSSIVERMMAKDPSRRYQKPEEVVKALAPFLAGGKKLERLPLPEPKPEPEPTAEAARKADSRKKVTIPVAKGVKPGIASPPTLREQPGPVSDPVANERIDRKRPIWVFFVFGAYLILFAGVIISPLWMPFIFETVLLNRETIDLFIWVYFFPSFCFHAPSVDSPGGLFIGPLVISIVSFGISVSLLIVPIGKQWDLPRLQKSIVVPLLGSATAAAIVCLGGAVASSAYLIDHGPDSFGVYNPDHGPISAKSSLGQVVIPILLFSPIAVWVIWLVAFGVLARSIDRLTWSDRLYQSLVAGSVLELLIAIPLHILVRRRGECCAGMWTGFGIGVGLIVMLIAIGPGVFFLFFRRYKQVYKPRNAKRRAAQRNRLAGNVSKDEV